MRRTSTPATPVQRRLRCAIYTRKSSEEGLDMEFNSLDAQREACESFIASQKAEGWVALRDRFDDGGFSGGTLERPALQRLLADIEAGLVDVVVVYKIDRLSRALMDFARLVEVFDRHGVTFVSVTQSFNTTTSMGRLTLNILLSFAQFEREVIGERIRDKFAASRARGMWMGGYVPTGYDVKDRKLVVNEAESATIRMIFERFVQLGSATTLVAQLAAEGVVTKRGKPVDKGFLYKLLNNRVYLGEAVHKGTSYPGEHAAIIDQDLWNRVHGILQESPRSRAAATRTQTPALLKGLIFGPTGTAMTPTATKKGSRLYRYYASMDVIRGRMSGTESTAPQRLPAEMVENAVVREVRRLVRTPEIVAQTVAAARRDDAGVTEHDVVTALDRFDEVWSALFPAEQARLVRLLVDRVTVTADGIAVDLRTAGLGSVVREMLTPRTPEAVA
ncbi:recombinase family protein [Rhodospirillum centenum]|uniref:Gin (G segment invertase), phage site-specific recombinase, resolvase n=1 Tax=Rhodospirillum centenum (strain ATCC 51521 / SW) TaxID=414684 RepID=B6IPV0_RHOCS|nr:recombinase family protein [Rhodospirillum centenum]ACI97486.1 Gin (G segment invertase), phage site-specific recombinase, resolvase [Rhodospirillum centenum SW]